MLKDKRRNPFSFKTYSFSLSKDNYFQFLSNGEPLTLKKVQSMVSDIAVSKVKVSVNEAEEKESNINAYYDTFKKYGQEVLGVDTEDVGEIFNVVTKKFSEIMAKSAPSTNNANEKRFYENFLKNFEPLMLSNPTAKQPINVKMFSGLVNDLNNIKNIDDSAKKQIFGDSYQKDYAQTLKKLAPLSQFVNQIDSIYHKSRDRQSDDRAMNAAQAKIADMLAKSSSEQYASEKQAIDAEINKFFALVRSGELGRKEGEKDTQFKLPLAYALQFAKQTKSDYDESYPEVIIDGNVLFTSAQNSAELLKAYVEPIYDNFNALDVNLKRYFVKNEPKGIKDAQTSTEKLKIAIEEHPGVKQDKAASDITAVQENINNKPLTKHWSDDILKDILND